MSYPKGVPGRPHKPPVSPAWASAIQDYLETITAAGRFRAAVFPADMRYAPETNWPTLRTTARWN